MSDAKHTKGPWSVGRTMPQNVDPRIGKMFQAMVHVGDGSSRGNCHAIVYMGGPGATRCDQESVEANARLIAAAPDLLAACLMVANKLTGHHRPTTADLNEMQSAVNAAIAKAEGRA